MKSNKIGEFMIPKLVTCMHRESGADYYLSCESCDKNLAFKLFSFDEIAPLVDKITEYIFESDEMTWDKNKTRFFVSLIANETVINAVEHGILKIGFEEKREAIKKSVEGYTKHIQGKWRKAGMPVTVSLCVDPEHILLGFHDSGKGFDYHNYSQTPIFKDNVMEPSGRGLALLGDLGVQLYWNKEGNTIWCSIPDTILREPKGYVNLDKIFQVGVEEFDNQHKKLFAIVNEVSQIVSEGKNKEAAGDVLARLMDYTVMHFRSEEEMMKEYGYPDYESHKKQHDFLAARVKELYRKFQTDGIAINEETLGFLIKWVLHHIAKVDKDYAPFLKSKGVR